MHSLASEIIDDYLIRYLAYKNYSDYVERLNLNKRASVLEIGCGGGNLSRFIAKKISEGMLYCLDSSSYWIGVAKKRLHNKNIIFLEKRIEDMSEDLKFDNIIIHYALHDMPKNNLKSIIRLFDSILEKGSYIYVREPTRLSHGMSSDEIRRLFQEEGFKETCSQEEKSFPMKGTIYEGVFTRL